MAKLVELDKSYRESFNSTHQALKESYKTISSSYEFDLSKTEITQAILERLKAFYLAQFATKEFLEKRIIPDAADYFVEATLFFLRIFLEKVAPHLKAVAEQAIERRRGAIRPDISIWNGDKVIAIIECKTQLGYKRDNWEEDFIKREKRLTALFPKAKAFLLVSTSDNWGGFGTNRNVGKKYFSLLGVGVRAFSYTDPTQILNPIEGILEQIKF